MDSKLRKKAEERLRERAIKPEGLSPEKTRELIQELEVHQIELEMQNEELRQAQLDLGRSRSRYADLYDFAPVGYFTLNQASTIQEVNLTGAALLGWERGMVIKKPFFLYVKGDDKDFFRYFIGKVLKNGTKESCEIKILKRDGSWFHARLEALPVEGGQIRAALIDISQLKQTQEELQLITEELERRVEKRTHELKESESRYKYLLESITDYIYTITIKNGRPDGSSYAPTCQAVTGYSAQEFEADSSLWLNVVHPEDKPALTEQFSRVMAGGSAPPLEHRIIHKNGSVRWVKHTLLARFDENGRLRAIHGLIRDITDRKNLEEMEAEYLHSLEKEVSERTDDFKRTFSQLLHAEKLSDMGRFSASIAHELNNPIFAIRNVLGGVKKRGSLEEEDRELVDMAIEECDRVKGLILDLQNFHRPTSGIKTPMDINRAIDNMLLFQSKEFQNRNIKVEKNYAPALPRVSAIEDQIKQVFLNLLTNAMDALPEEGGNIIITTECLDREEVAVHIRDNGTGINPADLDHIFEPFFSTKQEVKGTGLGLSISFGIIQKHGGDIKVSSEPGKGTTFSVVLPISAPPEKEKSNKSSWTS